jgi:hypothetical protein
MGLVVVLAAGPASAFHDERGHLVDYTAHTMTDGDVRVGVWNVGWAPWRWLTLDTYTWPWLKKIANASAKFRIWGDADWTVAAKLGYFTLDLHDLTSKADPVRFHVLPVEVAVSRRLGSAWEVSAAGVYTPIVQKGTFDAGDVKGAAGYTNTQVTLAVEWRLSERWALFVRSRHLLAMQVSGKVTNLEQIDPYTTVEIQGDAATDDVAGLGFPQTFQVVPGFAYSRAVFNVEVGLGYGNWHVPGVNVFVPFRSIVPQLDVYWRW